MITSLVYLVVYLIVLGLIAWILLYAVQSIPMGPPFAQVARVIIIVVSCLIAVLLLLNFIGILGPMGSPPQLSSFAPSVTATI